MANLSCPPHLVVQCSQQTERKTVYSRARQSGIMLITGKRNGELIEIMKRIILLEAEMNETPMKFWTLLNKNIFFNNYLFFEVIKIYKIPSCSNSRCKIQCYIEML